MKTLKIPELKIEIETEIHNKGKSFKKIKIPKGWRIPTYFELQFLRNSDNYRDKLNLLDSWEFVENPDKISKDNGYIARFVAISGRACLGCDWVPEYSGSSLGVRFVRGFEMTNQKTKEYGFIVRFKRRTSKKERERIIKLMLKQKCVDNIMGAITFEE